MLTCYRESRDKFDVSKMDPGKDSDMRKTIEMSKQEALVLRAERKQMEEVGASPGFSSLAGGLFL